LCECLLAELLESAVYSSIYAQVSGRYLSPLGTAAGVFWITGGFDLKSGAEDAARAARQAGEALQSRESADEPAGATNEEPQQDTAATGGRVARGYKPRSDAAGRQQWVWVGDGTIVTEKPTIIKEAAIELAAARRGTADLGAISACISLCYDFYSPHRALAATCIAEIMAGRPRMAASCDTLAGVLRALAKEKRARAREALVGVLVELAVVGEQDGKVVRALVSMLDDPDRRCRAQAVAAVSALAPRNNAAGALENLLRRLTSEAADGDNVWYAREAALACLAALASAVDEVGAVMGGAGGARLGVARPLGRAAKRLHRRQRVPARRRHRGCRQVRAAGRRRGHAARSAHGGRRAGGGAVGGAGGHGLPGQGRRTAASAQRARAPLPPVVGWPRRPCRR